MAIAAVLSGVLARALARLVTVLPTSAGMLAFLGRGLGRRPALLLVLPYLLLTLLLMGAEATVVGLLLRRAVGLPPVVGALGFLVGTWALCRSDLRLGMRAQAMATWALLLGLGACALHEFHPSVLVAGPPPSLLRLLAAIGQATFLFMGFELTTSFAGLTPGKVRSALPASVALLAVFYGTLALGFAGLHEGTDEASVPQLAMAVRAGGRPTLYLITVLSLLASFSSFNGALLSLSRLVAALAGQGLLPRAMVSESPGSVPRRALLLPLGVASVSALLISAGDLLLPVLQAAAVAAALVYAGLLLSRERPPFREVRRPRWRSLAVCLAAGAYGLLALGVMGDAGPLQPALLGTLALVYGAAAIIERRDGRRPSVMRRAAAG